MSILFQDKKSIRWNYLDQNFQPDFTQLERLPTNTGIALIDRLNREANEQSDRLEELFIEIACDIIDEPARDATRSFKRRFAQVRKEAQIDDQRGVVTLPQDFFDDNGAENDVFETIVDSNMVDETDEDDDFDVKNPGYLAILNEIQGE